MPDHTETFSAPKNQSPARVVTDPTKPTWDDLLLKEQAEAESPESQFKEGNSLTLDFMKS